MFKKSLATALLVATVPAVASASWFLSTQAMNQGGTVSTRNGDQTVADLAVYKSYTTSAGIPVNVTAATGFTIKSVTINGVTTLAPVSPFSTTIAGSATKDKSVSAVFATTTQDVTASNPVGSVTPASVGNIYYGYKLKDKLVFTFLPKFGYKITAINGATGATVAPVDSKGAINAAVDQKVTVTYPVGYTFTAPVNLVAVGSTTVVDLNAVLPQTIVKGKTATLAVAPNDQLLALSPAYKWTYVSGPANTRVGGTQGGDYGTVNGDNGLTSTTKVVPGPTVTFDNDAAAAPVATGFTTAGQYKFLVTATAAGKTYTKMAVVNVVDSLRAGADTTCQFCHSANNIGATWTTGATPVRLQTSKQYIYDNWSTSAHNHFACYQCHVGTNTGAHPGTITCLNCHHGNDYAATPYPQGRPIPVAGQETACAHCHAADGKNVHAMNVAAVEAKQSCIGCHDVAAPAHKVSATGDGVADNNGGVRAITAEFQKWSHHVTGVALNDAHCAACHLEGKVSGSDIIIDTTKHMVDAKTHLRNADTDAEFAWDPTAPNHTGMDNFCMSCHDGGATTAGATSGESVKIQALINTAAGKYNTGITASATNPFGDTISNRYDKMMRPAVVDVDGQFATGNNSHHAVKGARYTKRTRVVNSNDTRAMTAAESTAFANNSSAALYGKRSTIYDAGNFNSLYVPLGTDGTAATGLGDDSTLHCGDCHTVGQWAPGVTTNANGQLNTVAIGAHGSNNEYMLRNSAGTDARHRQNTSDDTVAAGKSAPAGDLLVCFNCHAFKNYGSLFASSGAGTALAGPHVGEYANGGRCNGPGNTISFAGYTTGVGTDGFDNRLLGRPNNLIGHESAPDFGNIFGIQCANCHNSGVENGYGGIHGSKVNTYVDGMGNTQKMERFLPGLGNSKYVPGTLGGITGGTTANVTIPANTRSGAAQFSFDYTTGGVSSDTNWEQKASTPNNGTPGAVLNAEGKSAQGGAGCYTLGEGTAVTLDQKGLSVDGGATTPNALGTWGGCEDHNAQQGGGDHGTIKRIVRPVTY